MRQWVKTMIWVLVGIIGVVIIGYGGCMGCVFYIATSNSCERFNIDNIELRARIDIPEIEAGSCSCKLDKEENTKTNYFKIRTDAVDMDRYVERNWLKAINDVDLDLSVFGKLEKIPEITDDNKHRYYYNSGNGKQTDYFLSIVDKSSGDLWVYIKYKD